MDISISLEKKERFSAKKGGKKLKTKGFKAMLQSIRWLKFTKRLYTRTELKRMER
jgi:hypothetical protein